METRFRQDFSAIRIHAGQSAGAVRANAFARGDDLHFAPGKYSPGTREGQRLLAHELAHVVQQRAGRVALAARAETSIVRDRRLEAEADDIGERAVRGQNVETSRPGAAPSTDSVVQLDPDDDLEKEWDDLSVPLHSDEPGSAVDSERSVARTIEKVAGDQAVEATVNSSDVAYMGNAMVYPLSTAPNAVHTPSAVAADRGLGAPMLLMGLQQLGRVPAGVRDLAQARATLKKGDTSGLEQAHAKHQIRSGVKKVVGGAAQGGGFLSAGSLHLAQHNVGAKTALPIFGSAMSAAENAEGMVFDATKSDQFRQAKNETKQARRALAGGDEQTHRKLKRSHINLKERYYATGERFDDKVALEDTPDSHRKVAAIQGANVGQADAKRILLAHKVDKVSKYAGLAEMEEASRMGWRRKGEQAAIHGVEMTGDILQTIPVAEAQMAGKVTKGASSVWKGGRSLAKRAHRVSKLAKAKNMAAYGGTKQRSTPWKIKQFVAGDIERSQQRVKEAVLPGSTGGPASGKSSRQAMDKAASELRPDVTLDRAGDIAEQFEATTNQINGLHRGEAARLYELTTPKSVRLREATLRHVGARRTNEAQMFGKFTDQLSTTSDASKDAANRNIKALSSMYATKRTGRQGAEWDDTKPKANQAAALRKLWDEEIGG